MSRPIIFDKKNKKCLERSTFKLERELQRIVEQNMEDIFSIRFLETEYQFYDSESGNGRMDTIGLDSENRPVVIEYKLDSNENVINQSLFYINWLKNHKADFELLVLKKLGKNAMESIEWEPRAICIASSFTKYDNGAINQMNADILLYQYYVYGNNNEYIAFENVNSRVSLPSRDKQEKQITKVDKKSNSYEKETFTYIYNNMTDEQRNFVDDISSRIIDINEDISMNDLSRYRSFRRIKNFACIVIHNSGKHNIYINTKYTNDMKQFDNIADYKEKGHWGTGDVRISISKIEDLDKTIHFIERAYQEN